MNSIFYKFEIIFIGFLGVFAHLNNSFLWTLFEIRFNAIHFDLIVRWYKIYSTVGSWLPTVSNSDSMRWKF